MFYRLFLAIFVLSFSIQAQAVLGWADNGADTAGINSVASTGPISTTATMGPVGVASCDSSADCWTSDGTNGIEYYRNFYDVSDGTCNTDVDVTTAAYTDERAVDIDLADTYFLAEDVDGTLWDTFPAQGYVLLTMIPDSEIGSGVIIELVNKVNISTTVYDRLRVYIDSSGVLHMNIYNGTTLQTVATDTRVWFVGKEYVIKLKFGTGGQEIIVNGVTDTGAINASNTQIPNTGTQFNMHIGRHVELSQIDSDITIREISFHDTTSGDVTDAEWFPGYLTGTTAEDKTGNGHTLTLRDLSGTNSGAWSFLTPVTFGGMYPSTALCGETRLLDSAGAIDPDATDEVAITTTTVTKPSWFGNDLHASGVLVGSLGYINKTSNEFVPLGELCDQTGGSGTLNCLKNGTYPAEKVRAYYEANPSGSCVGKVNVATGLNYIERYPNYYDFAGLYYGTQATLLVTPPAIFEIRGKIETNSTSQMRLWTKRQDASPLYEVYLEMMATGKLRFTQYLAGTAKIINSQTAVNDGDMVPGGDDTHTYKVVIASGTNAVELWVDGIMEASITGAALISEVDNIDFHIGSDSGGGFKFDGIQYYLDVYDVSGSAYLARYHFIDDLGGTVLDDSMGAYDITLTSASGWAGDYALDLSVLSLGTEYCIESVAVDSEGVASSYTGTEQRAYIIWNDFYVKPENGQVVVSSVADALTSYTIVSYDLFYAESTTVSPTVYDSYVHAVANPYTLTGLTNYDGMAFMKVPCLDASAPCTNYIASDVVETSPSNDYATQTAWIHTDQENVAYSSGTASSYANSGGTTFKNRIIGSYVKDGNNGDPNNRFVRITLEGHATQAATVAHASICQQAWIEEYSTYTLQNVCTESPMRVTFGSGNNGGTIPAGGSLVSDWIPFPVSTGRNARGTQMPGYWVSWHISDATQYYQKVTNTAPLASEGTMCLNSGVTPTSDMVFARDFSGWGCSIAAMSGLSKLEISQAPEVETKINNDNVSITYTGSWSNTTADVKYFMGDAKQSSTVNDYFEFTATGNAFFMTFGATTVNDSVTITVDDLVYDTIDLISKGDPVWNHMDTMLLYQDKSESNLSHTIRVTKNTAVATKVDALVVIDGRISAHEIGDNVSAFGDSLTDDAIQGWVATFADHYGYTAYNHGVASGYWSEALNNMFVSLHDDRPRIVTIMMNHNHIVASWQNEDEIKDRVRSAIAYAYYILPSYSKIIVGSEPHTTLADLTNPTRDERVILLNSWTKEVVAEFPGVYWADAHAATENSPQYLDTSLVHYDEDLPIANAFINAKVLH